MMTEFWYKSSDGCYYAYQLSLIELLSALMYHDMLELYVVYSDKGYTKPAITSSMELLEKDPNFHSSIRLL